MDLSFASSIGVSSLVRVGHSADRRVVLESTETADKFCAARNSQGRLFGRNGANVMINAWRWRHGADGVRRSSRRLPALRDQPRDWPRVGLFPRVLPWREADRSGDGPAGARTRRLQAQRVAGRRGPELTARDPGDQPRLAMRSRQACSHRRHASAQMGQVPASGVALRSFGGVGQAVSAGRSSAPISVSLVGTMLTRERARTSSPR